MTTVRSTMFSKTAPAAAGRITGSSVSPGRARGYGNRRGLGRAQVAGHLVFIDRPHHQLVRQMIAPGVELDGLVHVAVFLLDGAVVGGDVHGVLAALGIGLLQ